MNRDLYYYARRVAEHVMLTPEDDCIMGMIATHGKQFITGRAYYDKDLPDNTSLAAALTELAWFLSQHTEEPEAQSIAEPKSTKGKAPQELVKRRLKMERG